jgi:hypothetical protein
MTANSVKRFAAPSKNNRLARDLRGFGSAGIFALSTILLTGNIEINHIVVPFGALFVLLWARLSHTPWREIGYIRPNSWAKTITWGLSLGIAFKLLSKAVIMPLLGAAPINRVYHYLAGNTALLPAAIWAMLVAGFAEETVFRGYLFERFGKLFGRRTGAKVLTVVITSVWFGLSHFMVQGFMGVVHATLLGLVFGTIYALRGRIFFLMIAHAAYDLTALALIYGNLELEVTHLFFK